MPTPRRIITFGVIVYIVFFSSYTVLRHYSYLTSAYDLGIFMQSLWTASHGAGFFFNTPEWEDIGTFSHFGVHNSPILIPLAVLYRVFPYAETLLIVQSIFLGFGALALFKFASLVLDEKRASYLSLMYLTNPLIHGINQFDFHPVSLAVPFIFLIPYYYETGQWKKMALMALIVLSVKEDAGLILISLGMLFLLRKHQRQNNLIGVDIALILAGIAWIALSVFVVIPHFSGVYPYFANPRLQRYAPGSFHLDYAVVFVTVTLFSLAFLPILNIRYFFPSLPLWLELLLSKSITMLLVGFQYPYMLAPYLFISSAYGLSELKETPISRFLRVSPKKLLRNALVLSVVSMLLFSPSIHLISNKYFRGIPFYMLLGIRESKEGYLYVLDNVTALVASTPCPVTTQIKLFPHHLANRKNTYVLKTPPGSSYIENGSIVLLAKGLSDYGPSVRVLNDANVTRNKVYYILEIDSVIKSCAYMNSSEFYECIDQKVETVVRKCLEGPHNEFE